MSDDAEKRHTLLEAQLELARMECARYGHSWSVIETHGSGPVAIVCDRCGEDRSVTARVDVAS